MDKVQVLQDLAAEHGTPLIVVDHEILPRVQIYYAVKANPDPAILETFYNLGASFDVASLCEFLRVHKNIEHLTQTERQKFIWGKIIYANPVKAKVPNTGAVVELSSKFGAPPGEAVRLRKSCTSTGESK